jgi:hypothetical protein
MSDNDLFFGLLFCIFIGIGMAAFFVLLTDIRICKRRLKEAHDLLKDCYCLGDKKGDMEFQDRRSEWLKRNG